MKHLFDLLPAFPLVHADLLISRKSAPNPGAPFLKWIEGVVCWAADVQVHRVTVLLITAVVRRAARGLGIAGLSEEGRVADQL